MYFNEKGDTNIDKEFENQKSTTKSKSKNKIIYLVVGGIILLSIIIIIAVMLTNKSNKYSLELKGEEKIVISKGSDYIEPGYIAYDKKKNDITNQVEVTSNVDTSTTGEYEILYSINGINKVRYITVVENSTYIYLHGNVNMYLKKGEQYIEPGYEVYDSINQNLTEKVKVSGNVDTKKAGTYQIIYSVVNSRGETITEKRTIVVTEK